MSSLQEFLGTKLTDRAANGLLRKLRVNPSVIDFCSNDYLGLARSQSLFADIEKKLSCMHPISNGSTGSRLLSGNTAYHEKVEDKLAKIFEAESAVIFNSGYSANLAVLSAVPQRGDTILYDELAHASIKDGARLSLAARYAFRHNDVHDLEKKIKKATGRVFIAVESLYSMDGDECPLKEILSLRQKYELIVILDEAHSTGVFGKSGNGLAASRGVANEVDIRVFTFGKAMGVHGACVCGSEKLKQFLINFARPFIYTTAPDMHSLASIESSFEFLASHDRLQIELQEKINKFATYRTQLWDQPSLPSAIQTFIIQGNERVSETAKKLQRRGFDVRAILSPTVPKGKERLRICLHTFNEEPEIRQLLDELHELAPMH
jgi:8-amino-7-oxononanoate synthase